ncbi:helix-turn-helix domain-containing protein [Vagococcus intermedius]|uniref:Helix-turn-helix domain-containing protein n=1 Tax=Vagococcus intermedius TaxID=2991418 RepID=A0AAF0CX01_9ENTE|nr:helix-turn-helix transcriptional regulator [Vagococcus intermedius]WEG74376.1 helix-turn-helix domain-containing protein [Vagococcus intermedius]WEG76498.1 helix-turn-helix domain-containing protein [Vagococcus intermedius]
MNIGEIIKIKRKHLNLTQDELADKIHVSRQTISSWENSKSLPDVTSLILLSDVYEISLDELIKGDITMIKKLEVKESKEKLSTSFFVSTLLNILLIIVMMGLNSTGYKNSYIYFFISIILLINTVPVWLELAKHKNVTKKNKN